MTMRTVTLELLRHGPAHNQLLSPLTPYLALCGNYDAETVHVGFEHLQLARYVEQLRDTYNIRMASFALQDATREVSRLLESIRSLTAELASSDPMESRRIIHLRLVLSASELALLPFELATAPAAMPGQGQPLSLQTETPVCLTREVRRVAATTLQWPYDPRILMVVAAPSEVSEVPMKEHLEMLKAALAPYVNTNDPEELDEHLTVLREASLEDVRDACSRKAYTHVHILAHGIAPEVPSNQTRYGLAFHAHENRNNADVVSGERLASALRCHMRAGTDKQLLSSPAVVTIASCDSANVGNVLAQGASIAHSLHEQGIPLVVGSQFPLSRKGSVIMAELLYRRLLEGDDPRTIVHDLRQALHTAHPETHDWASVVVYAAFPNNLQSQVQHARFDMARRALEKMLARTADLSSQEQPASSTSKSQKDGHPNPEEMKQQLMEAMTRFEAIAPKKGEGAEQVKAWGVLASAWKQMALFLAGPAVLAPLDQRGKKLDALFQDDEFRKVLEKARTYYYKCYQVGATEAWPLVQYLALTVGLRLEKSSGNSKVSKTFKRLWGAATVRAEDNLRWGSLRQKAWAHASMAELALLSMLWRDSTYCRDEALHHVKKVLEIKYLSQYEDAGFDVFSLWRQLFRYDVFDWGSEEMRTLSGELEKMLNKRWE